MVSLIEITISGETSTGKSTIMREIKDSLEKLNLAVCYADRGDRNDPPDSWKNSAVHELPKPDETVIVLHEKNLPRKT